MNLKKLLITLALVSVSDQTLANQWNSVDNLVNASTSIQTTLDNGIKRVGGLQSLSATGDIAPTGYMNPAHMTYQQASDFNVAVGEVQVDIFSLTADEYFLDQYNSKQTDFNTAVDNFVAQAGIFITATYVGALAEEAQITGDAVKGQALQNYVTANNVLITNQNVDDYNFSADAVVSAAQQFAAVAAVYTDAAFLSTLQQEVDAAGQDYLNAGTAFFDENSGTLNVGFDFGTVFAQTIDMTAFIGLEQDFVNAGNVSAFYTTGPTQNNICDFVGPSQDPANICYVPLP